MSGHLTHQPVAHSNVTGKATLESITWNIIMRKKTLVESCIDLASFVVQLLTLGSESHQSAQYGMGGARIGTLRHSYIERRDQSAYFILRMS